MRWCAELVLQPAGSASPQSYPIADPTPIPRRGCHGQWGLGIPLPLGGLPPGEYQASLTVARRGRDSRATVSTSFRLATP